MTPDLRTLSGEELRREAKRADSRLADEIDRVRLSDPAFRGAVDWALEVEAEQLRRRGK